MPPPAYCNYALRLRPPPPDEPGRLAGEIEQVRSGELREFSDAAALLEVLRSLQTAPAARPSA